MRLYNGDIIDTFAERIESRNSMALVVIISAVSIGLSIAAIIALLNFFCR